MVKYLLEFPSIDESGLESTFYIDPDTQKMVENLGDLNLDDYLILDGETGSVSDTNLEISDPETVKKKIKDHSDREHGSPQDVEAMPRTAVNNYGYMDAPKGLGLAAMIPGPIGLVGKAVKAGIAGNNAVANAKAREAIGLEPKGILGQTVKGLLGRDKQGYIADVRIGDENYSTGFEALDNRGRTTLTPNEARMRGLLSPNGINELTRKEAKVAVDEFKKNKGINPSTIAPEKVAPELPTVHRNMFDLIDRQKQLTNPEVVANKTEVQANTTSDPIRSGLGLMDVSPSFAEKTLGSKGSLSDFDTTGLSEKARGMVETMSKMGFGDVGVNSGFRDVETNSKARGAKGSQHMFGNAIDLATKDLSPEEKSQVLDAALVGGAKGIGAYPSGALHVDVRENPATWGPKGYSGTNIFGGAPIESMPEWTRDNLQALKDAEGYQYLSMNGPVPNTKPEVSEMLAETSAPNNTTVPGLMSNIASTTPDQINQLDSTSLGQGGFRDLLESEPNAKSLAAQTLAGEIDLSKTDITTEEGLKEAFGIMSTIDNRVGKYGTLKDTILSPNQYSTWNTKAAANTALKNYSLNPELYDSLVDQYAADPKNNLGFTSYHANTVNPGWSGAMSNRTTLGSHTFGFLGEYGPTVSLPSIGPVVEPKTVFNSPSPVESKTSVGLMNDLSSMTQSFGNKSQNNNSTQNNASDKSSSGSSGNQSSGRGESATASRSSSGSGMTGTSNNPGKEKDDKI